MVWEDDGEGEVSCDDPTTAPTPDVCEEEGDDAMAKTGWFSYRLIVRKMEKTIEMKMGIKMKVE